MLSRRQLIQSAAILTGSYLIPNKALYAQSSQQGFMPEESEHHSRTWIAFAASEDIWHPRQVPVVQRNLALITKTIARYEPVSILVGSEDYKVARQLLGDLNSYPYPIELINKPLNDLWIRDTGPTFVYQSPSQLLAVDFNFNGWGKKQQYDLDGRVASFIAEHTGVPRVQSSLVLEGGCFEVDGDGTAIMTESCILNDNRNPGKSKAVVEAELKRLLGLKKIIWLPGIKGKDITDSHTDFYARFVKPGVVAVSREMDPAIYDYEVTRDNIKRLQSARDARGRSLKLAVIDGPLSINTRYGTNDFAAGYIGYYVCNGAVIMQKFGDAAADSRAKQQLQTLYPDRVIEQIAIDGIASGGGSIHCATQQQPLIKT